MPALRIRAGTAWFAAGLILGAGVMLALSLLQRPMAATAAPVIRSELPGGASDIEDGYLSIAPDHIATYQVTTRG